MNSGRGAAAQQTLIDAQLGRVSSFQHTNLLAAGVCAAADQQEYALRLVQATAVVGATARAAQGLPLPCWPNGYGWELCGVDAGFELFCAPGLASAASPHGTAGPQNLPRDHQCPA